MLPAVVCEWVLLRLWPKELRKGLCLIDPFPETRADFVAAVGQALDLIEANDPMRFARLRREIRSFLNVPLPRASGAEYCRFRRTCRIDLRYFRLSEDREAGIFLLACRLIHESTHGYLYSKRMLQLKDRVRVEMLCFKEEARFAKRLGYELGPNWGFIRDELKPPPPAERRRLAAARARHPPV